MKNKIPQLKQCLSHSLLVGLTNIRFSLLFKLSVSVFLLLMVISTTNAQDFIGSGTFGSTGTDGVASFDIDELGNKYLTGTFNNELIVQDTLMSNGQDDIFLMKVDKFNNYLWSKSFGSVSDDESTKVVYKNGFIYTTGFFWDDIMMDTVLLQAGSGGSALYVSKWDTSGHVIWTNVIRGNGIKSVESIALDGNDNVLVTGYYSIDLTFEGTTIINTGDINGFVMKYDTQGDFQWYEKLGNTKDTKCRDIQIDSNDDIYVLGQFNGQVFLGSTLLTSGAGDFDGFVFKMDGQNQQIVWQRKLGGVGDAFPQRIGIDDNNNAYITGYFINSMNLAGQTLVTASNDHDFFIGKIYDNNIYTELKSYGGPSNEFATTMDIKGNQISIAGYFTGNAVINGQTLNGDLLVPRSFFFDIDTNLTTSEGARVVGDIGFHTFIKDVKLEHGCCKNTVMVGNYEGQFSPYPLLTYNSVGSFDCFIGQYNYPIVSTEEVVEAIDITIFPNPSKDVIYFEIESGHYQLSVFNSMGQLVLNKNERIEDTGRVNISALNKGIYFLTIKSEKEMVSKLFIVR